MFHTGSVEHSSQCARPGLAHITCDCYESSSTSQTRTLLHSFSFFNSSHFKNQTIPAKSKSNRKEEESQMTAEELTQTMATLSVQDSEQLEDLIVCARYGELEEIQDLVKSSGLEKVKSLLAHRGEYGKTPLHMAAANNHICKDLFFSLPVSSSGFSLSLVIESSEEHWPHWPHGPCFYFFSFRTKSWAVCKKEEEERKRTVLTNDETPRSVPSVQIT